MSRQSNNKSSSNSLFEASDLPSLDAVVESVVGLGSDEASSVVGDTEHQLRRLVQTLRNRRGRFALIFVVCNEVPLRDALVRELEEELPEEELSEAHIGPEDSGLLDKLLRVPGAPRPLFAYGLENLLPSGESGKLRREETLQELQLRREQFRKLARPLVLWMPEYVYTLIGQHAVDFWSWQSGTFFFTEIQSRKVGRHDVIDDKEGQGVELARFEVIEEMLLEHEPAILQGALAATRNRLRQLPPPPRDFTGRAFELSQLRAVLRDGLRAPALMLQGKAGIGKTALALKLANDVKDEYLDGNIYLDLKGSSAGELKLRDVMWHVVSSLEPELVRGDDKDLPNLYQSILAKRRIILFLDNAEDHPQVNALVPPKPSLLLLTSRSGFEKYYGHRQVLCEMSAFDAEDLLLTIEPRIGNHAPELAKQCNYLPMALRLVASTLRKSRSQKVSSILERLQSKEKSVDPITAALNVTYNLLDKRLRSRWRTLAVFSGFFDLSAAAVLWRMSASQCRQSLAQLQQYGLLESDAGGIRFRLHELARKFADLRIPQNERQQVCYRHASYYFHVLKTVTTLYLLGNEHITEGLSLFDTEEFNIDAGQKWAANHLKNESAARLCIRYADAGIYVLSLRKHPSDLIRWEEAALKAAVRLNDRQAQANRLGNLGLAYASLGETRRAIACYERALAVAREIGYRRSEGNSLGNLGSTYAHLGQFKEAIEHYEQALVIAKEVSDKRGEENALGSLGNAYLELGEAKTALEYHSQALLIAQEIGDKLGQASTLGNLGSAYLALGEVSRAIDYYERALAIAQELGDRRTEAMTLAALGNAFSHLGEFEKAIEYYQDALLNAHQIGDKRLEGLARSSLGTAYAMNGQAREAIEHYRRAVDLAREMGNLNDHANNLVSLARMHFALGQKEEAVESANEAIGILKQIGSPSLERASDLLSRIQDAS